MFNTHSIESQFETVPAPVWSTFGQLTQYDRLLYYHAAKTFYSGKGVIVDGGALVGATTAALAEGLRANTTVECKNPSIYVYDLFQDEINGYSSQLIRRWYNEEPDGGNIYDFERHYLRNISAYSKIVKTFKGDLTKIGYHDSRLIEILSIDVAKTPEIMLFIAKNFFPKMIPGESIVLHQDYIFAFQPWLHICMEILSEYFVKIYDVPTQCTAVFFLEQPIHPSIVNSLLGSRSDDYYKIENVRYLYAAIEKAETRIGKILLTGALAYFYHQLGRQETANFVAWSLISQYDVSRTLIEKTELKSLYMDHLKLDYSQIYT